MVCPTCPLIRGKHPIGVHLAIKAAKGRCTGGQCVCDWIDHLGMEGMSSSAVKYSPLTWREVLRHGSFSGARWDS